MQTSKRKRASSARVSLHEAIELILIANRELAEQQLFGKEVIRERITVKI
ncbi:hypothetical protein [Iningainema tapete]|nr:hypothetical protein [Iningainema tapete]